MQADSSSDANKASERAAPARRRRRNSLMNGLCLWERTHSAMQTRRATGARMQLVPLFCRLVARAISVGGPHGGDQARDVAHLQLRVDGLDLVAHGGGRAREAARDLLVRL